MPRPPIRREKKSWNSDGSSSGSMAGPELATTIVSSTRSKRISLRRSDLHTQ